LIRAFIALPLPGEVQSALGEVAQQLAPQSQGVKWVKPGNIHLTLRFLGDTDPEKVPALSTGLDHIAAQHPPFPLRLGALGTFPNRTSSLVPSAAARVQPKGNPRALDLHRPRVLWVGLEQGGVQLQQLRHTVEDLALSLGWERETQQFKPHLTLGRVREGGGLPQKLPPVPPLEFQAGCVEFIESRLRSEGPEYHTLHQARLG